MIRGVAFLMALPALLIGSLGLAKHFAKDAGLVEPLESAASVVLHKIGLFAQLEPATELIPASVAMAP